MAINRDKVQAAAAKLLQQGKFDKAVIELQRLVEDDPTDVRTFLKLGETYPKMGKKKEALAAFDRAASIYAEQGFFLKAVAVLKQLLRVDSALPEMHLKLAELYQQLGLTSDALSHYQQVALFHEQAGRARETLDILKRMVDLDPDNIPSRIKLGELFAQQGLQQEAVAELRGALGFLKAQQRFEDYTRVGEKLVQYDATALDVVRELAQLYLARAEPSLALSKLQISFRADGRNVETLSLMAQAFLDMQQVGKTIVVYKELAKIHQTDGNTALATGQWTRVLELVPDDDEALRALGRKAAAPATIARPAPLSPAPLSPAPSSPAPLSPAPLSAAPPSPVPLSPAPLRTAPLSPAPLSPVPTGPASVPAPLSAAPLISPRSSPLNAAPFSTPSNAPPSTPVPAAAVARAAASKTVSDPHAELLQKLLTETDVYVKYGLKEKATEHLVKIFALRADYIPGLEKQKQLLQPVGGRELKDSLRKLVAAADEQEHPRLAEWKAELISTDNKAPSAVRNASAPPRVVPVPAAMPDALALQGFDELLADPSDSVDAFDPVVAEPIVTVPQPSSVSRSEVARARPYDLATVAGPAPPPVPLSTSGTMVLSDLVSPEQDDAADEMVRRALHDISQEDLELATEHVLDIGDSDIVSDDGGPLSSPDLRIVAPRRQTSFDPARVFSPANSAAADAATGSESLDAAARRALDDLPADLNSAFGDGEVLAELSLLQLPPDDPAPAPEALIGDTGLMRLSAQELSEIREFELDRELDHTFGRDALTDRTDTAAFANDAFAVPDIDDMAINGAQTVVASAIIRGDFVEPSAEFDPAAFELPDDVKNLLHAPAPLMDALSAMGQPSALGHVQSAGLDAFTVDDTGTLDRGKLGLAAKAQGFEDDPANQFFPDELEESEFFIQQDLLDEAREILAAILDDIPDSARVQWMLARVGAREQGLPEPPAPWEQRILEDVQAQLDAADLPAPELDRQVSVDEVLSQFKKGIAQTVPEDDAATRYDLGCAYRDMGLLDDAVGEFRFAARAPTKAADALYLIGVTRAEQGQHSDAIAALRAAVLVPNATKTQRAASHYQLGVTLDDAGDAVSAQVALKLAKVDGHSAADLDRRISALVQRVGDIALDTPKPKNIDYL